MARKAVLITIDELKEKCEDILNIKSEEFDPYENFTELIQKDLSKINFTFENWGFGGAEYVHNPAYISSCESHIGYETGYKTLENGLPVLFGTGGGDWEEPISFCIYWDGKNLRAYIPKKGNVYNKKEKCAYGSEEIGEVVEETEETPDIQLIREDIMNRIKIHI
jgi:hypothetical protein